MTSETIDGRQYKIASLDVLIGRQVGRYIVKRRIGQGGMGVVYEVWDVDIDRRLAMKVLSRRASTADEEQTHTNRFLQEAKAASRVGGRHAALIYGTGQLEDGRHFFVMEYLDGQDLRQRIRKMQRCMNPDDVIAIGIQMARVLHSAHRQRIVHRDIKPSNIFLAQVDGEEVAKLLDFGIAKVNAESTAMCQPTAVETQEQLVLGSYAYMSPEQLASPRKVDHRTDIFSLGIVLFEMLTGEPAYAGDTAVALHEAKKKPLRAVGEVRSDFSISPEWDLLLRQMLQWEPGNRPRDMREVAMALSRLSANGLALLSHWWRELSLDKSLKVTMPPQIVAPETWPSFSNGVPVVNEEGEQVIVVEASTPGESVVMEVSASQIEDAVSHVHQPKPVADWSTVASEPYTVLTGGTRISTSVQPVSLRTIPGVPVPAVMRGPQHEGLIRPPTATSSVAGTVETHHAMVTTNPSNPSISFASGVMQPMAPPSHVEPPFRWLRMVAMSGAMAVGTAAIITVAIRYGVRREALQPAAAISPVRAPVPAPESPPESPPAPVIRSLAPVVAQPTLAPASLPAAPALTPVVPTEEKAKAKHRRSRSTTPATIDPDGVM